jgi:Na+/proline symporter
MALGAQGYIGLCYGLSVPLVVAFGVYAVAYGRWFQSHRMAIKDTEAFTTARGTQSLWRIGWSFFCGAVGAWALVTPANFASFAGIVGVVSYAVTTGIPILLIAFAGERITSGMPHVYSLADFVGWRFGAIAKTVVALIALFNMCIVLLAEYTTIGSIFADYVGTSSWGIIVAVAVVTTCYTAYGGLAVSIATDQLQGIAAAIAAIVMVGYVGATYRHPIPQKLPENLGPNEPGWTSLFTLTASLIASTFFSEAMWQRVWASASPRTLRGGAVIGFSLSTILVFLSGFGGWLALVGGLTDENTNPNLYLFELLGGGQASSWIGVVAVLLAVCMNIGAVDSLQNGIASSLGGHFFKHAPLWWNRVGVVALNVPLAVLAITRGYNVLSLFLVTNLLCCCAAIPIALGLLRGKHNRFFTETGVIVGILTGVLGVRFAACC